MKRALPIAVALLFALLITSVAFAHMDVYGSRRGYGHKGRFGYGLKRGYGVMHGGSDWSGHWSGIREAHFCLRYEEALGLSEKQIDALEDLRDEFAKARIEKRADLDELRLELDKALDEDKVDLSNVKSLNSKIADLQAELRYMRIEESIKAEGILSEGQLDRLESPRREIRGRSEGDGYCPYY